MDSSTSKDTHWLNAAETTAVIGSIVGSITSVFLDQFIWATIPLSATATFGLLNHQRLKRIIESEVLKEQSALSSLVKENYQNQEKLTVASINHQTESQKNKSDINELQDIIERVQSSAAKEIAKLKESEQNNFNNTNQELIKIQKSLKQLDSLSHKITKELETLDIKHKDLGKLVRGLQAINIFSQNIKEGLNVVQSHFERGLAYQRLGNRNKAIEDFSKTIELANNHAKAYHNRGLIYHEVNINQKAILDLSKASKIYFEKGNLDKYKETKDLTLKIHQQQELEDRVFVRQEPKNSNEKIEKVAVNNLFD